MPREKAKPDDPTRLKHIIDAAKESLSFIEGKTKKDVEKNRQLALSLVKEIEIIGEAASQISESFKSAHPDLPWNLMIATRNRLIHGYFDIDLDVVWSAVTSDLPPLLKQLEKIKL